MPATVIDASALAALVFGEPSSDEVSRRLDAAERVAAPALVPARALGAEPVDSPFKVECCGSYETVNRPELAADKCHRILSDALRREADLLVTSCPLCEFNLDERQELIASIAPGFKGIPVLYFSSLVAIAFDLPEGEWGLESAHVDPMPVLRAKVLDRKAEGGA